MRDRIRYFFRTWGLGIFLMFAIAWAALYYVLVGAHPRPIPIPFIKPIGARLSPWEREWVKIPPHRGLAAGYAEYRNTRDGSIIVIQESP